MNDKRKEVLVDLEPIAKVLNIEIDYVIEEHREYLVCNGQKICTIGTSL